MEAISVSATHTCAHVWRVLASTKIKMVYSASVHTHHSIWLKSSRRNIFVYSTFNVHVETLTLLCAFVSVVLVSRRRTLSLPRVQLCVTSIQTHTSELHVRHLSGSICVSECECLPLISLLGHSIPYVCAYSE